MRRFDHFSADVFQVGLGEVRKEPRQRLRSVMRVANRSGFRECLLYGLEKLFGVKHIRKCGNEIGSVGTVDRTRGGEDVGPQVFAGVRQPVRKLGERLGAEVWAANPICRGQRFGGVSLPIRG
jgi:hypothetical protein